MSSGRGAGEASESGAGEAQREDNDEENDEEGETESAREAPAAPLTSAGDVAARGDKTEAEAGIAESKGAGAKASRDQRRSPGKERSASVGDGASGRETETEGVASHEATATPAERRDRPKSMAQGCAWASVRW